MTQKKIRVTFEQRFSARLRHSQKIQMSYVFCEYKTLLQKGGWCENLIYILLKSTQNLLKFRTKFELKKRHNMNGIGRWNSFKSIYHEVLALWAEERKSFETRYIENYDTIGILLLIVLWRNKNIADGVQRGGTKCAIHGNSNIYAPFIEQKSFWPSIQ